MCIFPLYKEEVLCVPLEVGNLGKGRAVHLCEAYVFMLIYVFEIGGNQHRLGVRVPNVTLGFCIINF